jgi:hypothetical protein
MATPDIGFVSIARLWGLGQESSVNCGGLLVAAALGSKPLPLPCPNPRQDGINHGGFMVSARSIVFFFFCVFATPLGARAATVDMALVLAVDVSESVDAGEYELQHEGIARAFENPQVVDAVKGGAQGAIDVLVLEWSDRDKQSIIVDWTPVKDQASAAAFAAKVRAGKRSSQGLTAIGDALLASAASFETLTDKALRRVIDVSGDGMANIGPKPSTVRDALVGQGIAINGLAILATEPWLDSYYNNEVIGGEGAFLLQVQDFQSFATAIQQKLLAEISARSSVTRLARGQMQ